MIDRNHPAVTRCFPDGKVTDQHISMAETFAEVIREALPHLTADDLPARLVRDIQIRTLRAAARTVTYEGGDDPLSRELVQAAVSALLNELADNIEEEAPDE